MPTLQQENSTLYYETWGEGNKNFTLINGTSRTVSDFRAIANFLVRQGYRVISLDNRGSGKTESDLNFSLTDCAKDVLAVWNTLGVEQSIILGMSLGGMIALETCILAPEKIDHCFLVSTGFPAWLKKRGEFKSEADYLEAYFSKSFFKNYGLLANTLLKQMRLSFFDDKERPRTEAQRQAFSKHHFKSFYQFRFRTDILHGEEDRIIPKAAAIELQESISPSYLHLSPGIGHLFLVESPKWFYEKITELLAIS